MTVRDLDGHRLGTVVNLGDTYFELEQDEPARRDFMVHFHLVARVEGDEVVLHPGHGARVPVEGTPGAVDERSEGSSPGP
jgi:diadenosine tetraphosphate (Ap4A) HIT family hydrolase